MANRPVIAPTLGERADSAIRRAKVIRRLTKKQREALRQEIVTELLEAMREYGETQRLMRRNW